MITLKSYPIYVLLICEIFLTIQCIPLSSSKWPSSITQGKGTVDNKPLFLNGNYIPAAMHVIFHLTDLMKYEVRPPSTPGPGAGPTTTTIRPTQPHKPGNYAPEVPPGPETYFAVDGWTYAWRTAHATNSATAVVQNKPQRVLPEDIDLFGAGPSELLHQINTLEDVDTVDDEDDTQIGKFAVNYEDTVNLDFLRRKKSPPARAYVTLLSLYDMLNKESKELNLNKYNGYSDTILKELIRTSSGSSSDQLKFVLDKIIENRNTRKDNILNKIKTLLKDLEKPDSYINEAIRYIPSLQFVS